MKITIQELSKSFGGRDIFNNFSLEVDSGVRLCVCGPNGTGKSTLLRLLAGVESPDAGRVLLPRGCRLGFVEQELSEEALETPLLTYVLDVLHDWNDFWAQWEDAAARKDNALLAELMQRQTELEAQYGYNPEHRAKAVLSGLGFAERKWGRTLRELSGGWRERAKLARVLTAGADVLLLDEPTNHLDVEAVEWLESFLLDFKGALVFVAHDRVFMDNVGSHVLYLGLSRPVFRKATYTQFLALQEEYNAQREREARALQDDLNRKMAFVERFRAKATKARQAGSRQKMAKKLEKQLEDYRPEPKRKELNFTWPEAPHLEKVALAAADLAFRFEDGRELWPALTFTLYRGQRVALVGPNGCGKSTLLRLLAGRLERCGGNVVTAPQLRLGFYTQHQMDTLRPDTTVLGEIRRLADPRTTEEELMSVLGLFLLGQEYFDRQVSALSGGEKSRLVLASLFLRRCNFLLLDEPTNHLDLESREALISALQKFDGTLLMVAHDRWLLSQVGAEAWELTRRGLDLYPDFSSYDAARRARLTQPAGAAKSGPGATGPQSGRAAEQAAPKDQPALSREEQKRLKREQAARRNALHKELRPLQERYAAQEKELAAVLEEQSAVEAQLADPQVYADHSRSNELLRAFDACKQRSEEILEEMTRLEEALQQARARFGADAADGEK
ncbi:ABC-F family ATP-binding cassette domain-containing protein [Desulfovibrio legallii]|uniref:ATP-binding cassette, subfamily F, member 3 n=1 Tax=Desulfovibrio legallii TaxID=571438 RepID=A0A1G7L303_9BACT|nr:ATP-binding cassette domain-containing protein [Desulfovibrio legallii]SDF43877.1 ATP-binding cassette, subfamily F, member 3 [Desulfovibrio legallii]